MSGESNLDLDKVQQAMDWLAESPEGDQTLKGLSDSFEAVRAAAPTDLNNAELRYIIERLVQQRNLGGWDKQLDRDELAEFDVQTTGGLFPQLTGQKVDTLPKALQRGVRVVNWGFLIKAAIPQGRF